jgi:hypothetical protein
MALPLRIPRLSRSAARGGGATLLLALALLASGCADTAYDGPLTPEQQALRDRTRGSARRPSPAPASAA